MQTLNKRNLANAFKSRKFTKEDDIKLFAFADIFNPIQSVYAPHTVFQSEHTYAKGGRADGTVSNLAIEYKKYNHFKTQRGMDEALYGRRLKDKNDSGLYQYIINSIEDNKIGDTIFDTFGIGFDGVSWLFSRFVPSEDEVELDITRTRFEDIYKSDKISFNAKFVTKKMELEDGIEQLIVLLNSTEKTRISKENLVKLFNPSNQDVRDSIMNIYDILSSELKIANPTRINTLYQEWNKTFGAMFGEENQATEFNNTADAIRLSYGIDSTQHVDSKIFLFSMQTYFNILLKLLIDGFLRKLTKPSEMTGIHLEWSEIAELFEGNDTPNSEIVSNFFEIHYYEWFTYVGGEKDVESIKQIVNSVIDMIDTFDLATYKVRPESIQDILQEVYMALIPTEVRHLLGEYFSPDWIVEFSLDRIDFKGDIEKKVIDPTCGSGAFIIQALKKVIKKCGGEISVSDAKKITSNIVGFDLNPISAVAAKANYILTLLSSLDQKEKLADALVIPIYIADSVLSPIVYSEESEDTFSADTTVGKFVIPKFESFSEASKFLDKLGDSILNSRSYKVFENLVLKDFSLNNIQEGAVKELYNKLVVLHRSAQDSFWGKILKNSFAPVMLKQRFDYVVGNPPWIAWKAMSKTYREGTLDVWKSYGIFEKSAYDKKTTHDDFGMAVTYVALDQYLKEEGKLFFLLPWTFIKSTKGGEGFRKFEITRNGQEIPVKVLSVDDFTDIKIFKPKHTVRTIGLTLQKNSTTTYPMKNWYEWKYRDKKDNFDAHIGWNKVEKSVFYTKLSAKPINSSLPQSAWLTLPDKELSLVDNVLTNGKNSEYRARKGIEPAGAKGVYILKHPKKVGDLLEIENDISRQRRTDLKSKGEHKGQVEPLYIYPMLGGRNIQRWKVVSNEFMVVPHKPTTPYGLQEEILADEAPKTYEWFEYFKQGLFDSRVQNGKFFNPDTQPWYRLDNVGDYTFSKYKVLWKEQSGSFSAVAIGQYSTLPNSELSLFSGIDKPVVVDSKVLMLATDTMEEAYYVSGAINSNLVRDIIDAYAVGLNRGTDVLDNIAVPKFDGSNELHSQIVAVSKKIHAMASQNENLSDEEKKLNDLVIELFK
ncbi:hypothetical protein V4_0829 [Lactococcus cremoris]|uniref:Eco57I restriction-modification methylase domain-containing protein n=1 Tax=Lactococcus lactis subsp. cremoris TaxID=1359 RepID=UPI0007AE91EC|nr:N-6 DNA methylase [Lactococcus cremoris]KZK09954.1 hypothetical protein V4_0829 [Lactococcus cremoris]